MNLKDSKAYPTREKVIEMYHLNADEQVYLADDLLAVEIMAFKIREGFI